MGTLTAQVEKLSDVRAEVEPMLVAHWEELALNKDKIPLAIDWDGYGKLEEAGILFACTIRQDGRIVAYYSGLISNHLHYMTTTMMMCDIFWTHHSVRGGTVGLRLMRFVEQQAKAMGIKKLISASKRHRDSSRLFTALGYDEVETIHQKWIGE